MRALLILCVALAVVAGAAAEDLQPWHGESIYTNVVGPYTRRSNRVMQKTAQHAPRPEGDIFITGYQQHVFEYNEAGERIPVVFDRDQQVYFHHSVMHREDPAAGKVWDSLKIHKAPFLFPQSPEVIGKPVHFSYGFGYRANDEVPQFAVCAHIKNWSGRTINYYIEYSFTYREFREGDRELTHERFGNDLSHGDVPSSRNVEPEAVFRMFGQIEQGHGPAKLVANQWHVHHGTVKTQLLHVDVRVPLPAHPTVDDILLAGPVREVANSESDDYTNTIQYHPISYTMVDVQPKDYWVVNATVNLETVWHEANDNNEWFMLFNLMWLSYEDGWNGHRTESDVDLQNLFGTLPDWITFRTQ